MNPIKAFKELFTRNKEVYIPSKIENKVTKLELRAIELIQQTDKLYDAGGEYKRHLVYSKLLEEFPLYRKRDVSLMIEKVIATGII